MTIYDVPVADTKFFPVSGDTMRQMKAEEERRDQIIRDRLAKHRAEHLIRTLKNGTGSPAKNSPDAADPNNLIGERTVSNDTKTVSEAPDATWHPLWCTGKNCEVTPGEYNHTSAVMSFKRDSDTQLPGWEVKADISLLDWNGDKTAPYAAVSLDGAEWVFFDAAGLTQLTGYLEALRERLVDAGEA